MADVIDSEGMRSVTRTASILNALARTPLQPQRLVDLSVSTGLHKATTRRLLAAMSAEGLVAVTPGGYELGSLTWLIGQAAIQRWDVTRLAAGSLGRIAQETHDVVLLAVPTGTSALCVAREEGDYPVLPTSIKVGAVRPLGCAAHALALLAALPPEEIPRVIAATAKERLQAYPSITDAFLRGKVEETLRTGYALAEGEIVGGMTAVAVPILDPWRRPLASISCTAIASRMLPERRPAIVDLLREEAARIEAAFRWRGETHDAPQFRLTDS